MIFQQRQNCSCSTKYLANTEFPVGKLSPVEAEILVNMARCELVQKTVLFFRKRKQKYKYLTIFLINYLVLAKLNNKLS